MFTQGVSGNPKGKPRGSRSTKTIIKQALKMLEQAICNDVAIDPIKLECARSFIDYHTQLRNQ